MGGKGRTSCPTFWVMQGINGVPLWGHKRRWSATPTAKLSGLVWCYALNYYICLQTGFILWKFSSLTQQLGLGEETPSVWYQWEETMSQCLLWAHNCHYMLIQFNCIIIINALSNFHVVCIVAFFLPHFSLIYFIIKKLCIWIKRSFSNIINIIFFFYYFHK